MKLLNREALFQFTNQEIVAFHNARLDVLSNINLNAILKRKNPYLFRAKNVQSAGGLIRGILDAYLSASEEGLFGTLFLENLVIYVSSQASNGAKSSAEGIDLEFDNDNTRYLVSIKSGTSWGNSSQHKRLEQNFQTAVRVLKQGRSTLNVQPILGICYGKTRTSNNGKYLKLVGQSFWHFISGDPHLYIDIVEPIGYRAKEHNDAFDAQRAALENRLTAEFIDDFCHSTGAIDWEKLVAFVSGNLTNT